MTNANLKLTAFFSAAMVFAVISPAQAYLDPGTGSIILQGILGAIGAGSFVIVSYWRRFKAMFSSAPAKHETSDKDAA